MICAFTRDVASHTISDHFNFHLICSRAYTSLDEIRVRPINKYQQCLVNNSSARNAGYVNSVWGIRVRFWVRFMISVRFRVSVMVNYSRGSFSALLREQHCSTLTVRHRNHSLFLCCS